MKSQRLDMIEEYVLEHKNASLDTLCEKFNVSKNTIRRDVDILLKRGSIMKVYGGVAALETPQTLPLLSYEERGGRFPEERKKSAAVPQNLWQKTTPSISIPVQPV